MSTFAQDLHMMLDEVADKLRNDLDGDEPMYMCDEVDEIYHELRDHDGGSASELRSDLDDLWACRKPEIVHTWCGWWPHDFEGNTLRLAAWELFSAKVKEMYPCTP